jgi:adenine-specific DNA-methyltransferase
LKVDPRLLQSNCHAHTRLAQPRKRPTSGNGLTGEVLAALLALHATTALAGTPLVVYGESVRVGPKRLSAAGVTFKQIPYHIRAR